MGHKTTKPHLVYTGDISVFPLTILIMDVPGLVFSLSSKKCAIPYSCFGRNYPSGSGNLILV